MEHEKAAQEINPKKQPFTASAWKKEPGAAPPPAASKPNTLMDPSEFPTLTETTYASWKQVVGENTGKSLKGVKNIYKTPTQTQIKKKEMDALKSKALYLKKNRVDDSPTFKLSPVVESNKSIQVKDGTMIAVVRKQLHLLFPALLERPLKNPRRDMRGLFLSSV